MSTKLKQLNQISETKPSNKWNPPFLLLPYSFEVKIIVANVAMLVCSQFCVYYPQYCGLKMKISLNYLFLFIFFPSSFLLFILFFWGEKKSQCEMMIFIKNSRKVIWFSFSLAFSVVDKKQYKNIFSIYLKKQMRVEWNLFWFIMPFSLSFPPSNREEYLNIFLRKCNSISSTSYFNEILR